MRWLLVFSLLAFASPALAQRGPAPGPFGRALRELPREARASAAPGQLTVWADFSAAADGRVPVYLINRTGGELVLEAQDGDPYLLREVERDGRWVRSQTFRYSTCGLSYMDMRVGDDHFEVVRGEAPPPTGPTAPTRYRLYNQSVDVWSNVTSASYAPEVIQQASHDQLALRTGGAATVEAALFAQPALPEHERYAAFVRARELTPAVAVPLLLRVLGDGSRNPYDLHEALQALGELDGDALAQHALGVLARPPSTLRTRLLSDLRDVSSIGSAELVTRLLELAAEPGDPDISYLLQNIARTREDRARDLLEQLEADTSRPVRVRIRAAYERAQWFSEDRIRLRVRPVGSYSGGHPAPVQMELELENTTEETIEFRFRELHEIFTFFASHARGRDNWLIEPRQRYAGDPAATETLVRLAPGERRTFGFHLLDYFDLPARDHVTVWVSVKIPGLHSSPALAGGGAGVNVQPAR